MRERDYHMNMLLPCRIPTHLGSEGVPAARLSTRFPRLLGQFGDFGNPCVVSAPLAVGQLG